MINLNVFMLQDFSTVRNIKIDYFKTLIFFLAAFNLVVFLAFVVHNQVAKETVFDRLNVLKNGRW